MSDDTTMINVFWHPDVLLHDMGVGVFDTAPSELMAVDEKHAEGPDRIRNMYSILERGPLRPHLRWHDGRHAKTQELLTFHTEDYVAELEAAGLAGGKWYTATTLFTPTTFKAALAAAGTTLCAMAHIMEGHGTLAYALVRPPGHHAAPAVVDGYCFFNNTALAALLALERGARRVAILDWDVHHGNGTQEGFYERDDVLTISLHMDHGPWGPTHLQTGKADEIGRGRGRGYNLNIPLPMGSGDLAYEHAMDELVAPALKAFAPDVLIVANGQDASQFDPNGRQLITMNGFRRLGELARELAQTHCDGKMLLVQEGGYQISYAALCLFAALEGVLGVGPSLDDPLAFLPEDVSQADRAIAATKQTRHSLLVKS